MVSSEFTPSDRLSRMLGFMAQDPTNDSLLADVVAMVLDEHGYELAIDLIEGRALVSKLPPTLINLRGLAALGVRDYPMAVDAFAALHENGANDAAVRFNLAWAHAMCNHYQAAFDLLDDQVLRVSDRAPALRILMQHQLGQFAEGLADGARMAEMFPDNSSLMAALATMAMDADEPALSRHWAERAGDHPEAVAVRGLNALEDGADDAAATLFDQAISGQPGNARAWIGRGLIDLKSGSAATGAVALEKGATLFGDHLGSWVGAGWGYLIAGDFADAQRCFDRAMAVDDSFAEVHGAIAVLAMIQGDRARASHHATLARRLDPESMGGAMARMMMLTADGDTVAADMLREKALSTAVGANGETLSDMLRAMALPSGAPDIRK